MTEPIVLPPGVALAILAFLLSLLPAGLFVWMWYLRRRDHYVPARLVTWGFIVGLVLVVPAYYLEQAAPQWWLAISPATAHYFAGALLPLQTIGDALLPAVATFLVVALIEEGLRYVALMVWFRRSRAIDQIFDGLIVGIAAGLGFATLENTIYFFGLFATGSFDTLVFVFFLRFMVSTLAHISFGGLMGALLARGLFSIYRPRLQYWYAFILPWFLHGLYDWLLAVNLVLYAVLTLLAPLIVIIIWSNKREFLVINREGSTISVAQRSPTTPVTRALSPWNKNAPWLGVLRGRSQTSGKTSPIEETDTV